MNENLRVSDAGLAMIKKFEGFSPKKYHDASGHSIGYGHFLTSSDIQSGLYNTNISQETANNLFKQDILKVENQIKQHINIQLNQNQFDALASMIYNTGPKPLSGGLGKLLNEGKFNMVPSEMKKWRKSEGKINYVLVSRRDDEASLFQGATLKSKDVSDPLHQYLERIMGKGYDPYKELEKRTNKSKVVVPIKQPTKSTSVISVLDKYLQNIAASEKQNKKIYKKYLPNNFLTIKVASTDYTNTIEYANIICAALDEELLSTSFIHTDGKEIEIECSIYGPQQDCFNAVKELTAEVTSIFKIATQKIGDLNLKTQFVMNKKSSYQQISFKIAEAQHRKFLLKFIG